MMQAVRDVLPCAGSRLGRQDVFGLVFGWNLRS